MVKGILHALLCLIGGILIGINIGKLDNILNIIMFVIGLIILAFSIIKSNK